VGVAVDEVARPAQLLHPPPHDRGVGARQLGRDLGDAEGALDATKERLQRDLVQLVKSQVGAPVRQHVGRRAETGPRVDQGGAADRAAERQHDRRDAEGRDLAGVAVEQLGHVAGPSIELVDLVPLALLEHGHAHAALRQLLGRDGAARARADHAGVDADATLARDLPARDDAPLAGVEGAGGVCAAAHQRASASLTSRPRATTASGS
jgi:hypothetical protein